MGRIPAVKRFWLALCLFLLVASAAAQEESQPVPQQGSEIKVAEIDALRWDNLRLKMESMQLRAQMSRMQLEAEQQRLEVEWQQLDAAWVQKYGVGLKQVRRDGEKWIIQDPERKP